MSQKLRFEIVPITEIPMDPVELRPGRPAVLIVDDERLIADSLSFILRSRGLSVMTAYDGGTALNLARATPPDLLISDVRMPGMSGIHLAMAVVQAVPACKVLLFSGHATESDLHSARTAGYDFSLLSKPVHPATMLAHISHMLGIALVQPTPTRWDSSSIRHRETRSASTVEAGD